MTDEPTGNDRLPPEETKPAEERSSHLVQMVAVLSQEIIKNTTTLGESMYVAHAIYDEIMFKAVTTVAERTSAALLDRTIRRLYEQGALRRPGERP